MNLKEGLKAIRAPFFTASVIPVLVGSAIVLASHEGWSTAYFFLTLIGVVCIQAGTNLANDYYDYKSGNDVINRNRSPFNGGSIALVEGVFQPAEIKLAFTAFFALSWVIALFLALQVGWPVLLIASFGILSGYYYSAPPIYLASRGVGEFFVGLNFGTLIVMGTYFVQAGSFPLEAFYASLPIALLISAVLMINQFPDYEADKSVGKNHLVVRLGKRKGVKLYIAMVALAYFLILLGPFLGLMPKTAFLALLPGFLAVKGIRILTANYDAPRALLPANAITIKLHFFTGLLLALGYLLGG
jgi:1,4-dihydroxy-2-naphthoate octaprenyltransferase